MKLKKPTAFIAAIIILLVVVLAYIFIELNSDVPTAQVVLPDPDTAVSSQPGDDGQAAYAQVTPDTVQSVIAAIRRPDGYTRTVTVEDFWGTDNTSVSDFTIQVSGTSSRITAASGRGLKYILVTDAGTWIWYDGTGDDAFYAPPGGASDADAWLRTLTYEDFLELPPKEILAAGYAEHNGIWCVYASYPSSHFGYETTLWISVSDGLLCATEIYDGEQLIYRMTGGAVDTAIPDDSVFTPPATANAPADAYDAGSQTFARSEAF